MPTVELGSSKTADVEEATQILISLLRGAAHNVRRQVLQSADAPTSRFRCSSRFRFLSGRRREANDCGSPRATPTVNRGRRRTSDAQGRSPGEALQRHRTRSWRDPGLDTAMLFLGPTSAGSPPSAIATSDAPPWSAPGRSHGGIGRYAEAGADEFIRPTGRWARWGRKGQCDLSSSRSRRAFR